MIDYWLERWKKTPDRFDVHKQMTTRQRQAEYDLLAGEIRKHLFGVGSVLDFGCGKGRFVPLFDDLKINYIGVEPCAPARKYCEQRFGDRFRENADFLSADLFLAVTVLQSCETFPDSAMRCGRWLIIESVGEGNGHSSFHHDYPRVAEMMGYTIKEYEVSGFETYRVIVGRKI